MKPLVLQLTATLLLSSGLGACGVDYAYEEGLTGSKGDPACIIPTDDGTDAAGDEIVMPYFSSEEGLSQCAHDYLVKGISCLGSYCDRKSLTCSSYAEFFDDQAEFGWSIWFSSNNEDDDGSWSSPDKPEGYICPDDGYVSGVGCQGMYCENMRVRCTTTSTKKACGEYTFTDFFSTGEEAVCDPGQFVVGIKCAGKFCDSIQLICRY